MNKLIVIVFFLLGTTLGFSQSDKLKEKINEKVEGLNSEIVAGDKSAALTDSQKTAIFNLEFDKIKEIRKAKKNGAKEEEIKDVRKKYSKKLFGEILTKEQRKARKKAKK